MSIHNFRGMIIPLIIANLLMLLAGWILWRAFYRRHVRYHFGDRTVNLVGRLLGHRQLFVVYLVHLALIMVLSSLLVVYVW